MKKAFFKLSDDKKLKIENIALNEFAHNGYKRTSFNRIIRLANISKGGMYKYCASKEELYHHIVDLSLEKLFQHVDEFKTNDDESLIQLLSRYTEHEFDFYAKNINFYQLHNRIFMQSNEEIDLEIRSKYKEKSVNIFSTLLHSSKSDINNDTFRIYQWVLTGLKNEYYNSLFEINDIESVKNNYKAELNRFLEILEKIS